jgi:RNA polymerase sigma-70 factor (ECF subfamily)
MTSAAPKDRAPEIDERESSDRESSDRESHALRSTPDLRTLFDAYYASIWRLLRRLGVGAAEVDDAAQEVFWVAARRLDDIAPGREHAFLYGVALRVASMQTRRQKVAPAIAPPGDRGNVDDLADLAPSPEDALERRRARELLDQVLCRMPIELRTVFVLSELEDMDLRDIAELEEIPLGTASSRLRRARAEFSAIAKRVRAGLIARRGETR